MVDGKATKAGFDDIAPCVEAFIAEHNDVHILDIIRKPAGFDPDQQTVAAGLLFDR